MIRTCYNCIHFCATLCDAADPGYHIHNWCKCRNALINAYAMADRYEYKDIYCDDLETGDACCYLFEEKDKPAFPDEWFLKNRQKNIENRLTEEDYQ